MRNFTGTTFRPGDEGYDEQRRALRPDLDPRPEVIVAAMNPADVRLAVLAARESGLPFAVQATGHGTHVAADDALLLKTSAMASVLVDPDRRIAKVGPGARWGQVLAAAAPFGLAPLSGSSKDVGVTGYSLGGGMGWLSRKFGFAADSVLKAEVVLADGRVVTASRDQYPDLFWALRGGGGNFGVVTSLEFRLHEVASVYAGTAAFPIENAAQTLAAYNDWAAEAPDEMSTAVVLRDGQVIVKAMYAGPADQARRILRPLWTAAGHCQHEDMREMAYADAAMGGTAARYFDFFRALPTATIDTLVKAHHETGSTVEVRHWAGATADAGRDAGPVGHRGTPFSVILDNPPAGLAEALAPQAIGGSFLNFLGDGARTRRAYTAADYRRLVDVKRFYDPDNILGLTHNIDPAKTRLLRAAA